MNIKKSSLLDTLPEIITLKYGENTKYIKKVEFIIDELFPSEFNLSYLFSIYSTDKFAKYQRALESIKVPYLMIISEYVNTMFKKEPDKTYDNIDTNFFMDKFLFPQLVTSKINFGENTKSESYILALSKVEKQQLLNNIDLKKIYDNLDNQCNYKQIIYSGAPGTGKSYKVEKELLNSIDNKNVIRTTFYQDYEYHNFIGSILPQIDGEILNYNFVPGPFTLALERALNCKTQQVYLIIEEMTRGNCAAIFGDTFQLLDRNNNGESEYPINNLQLEKYLGIEKIKIPNNLSIIGTINTSDQNVFPMDTAFKRRFDFEYVSTDPEYDFVNFNILCDVSWLDFYQKLNEIILDITNSEDKQLGPYFLKENDNLDKLYMYLWQDVLLNGKHSKVNRIFKRNMVTLSKIINCKEKPFVDNLINIEDTNEYN